MFSMLVAALFATSVVAVPTPDVAAVCKTNTFKTGKFEMNTLAPWNNGGDDGYSVGLHHRGYKSKTAAKLTAPVANPNGLPTDVQLFQSFNACANTEYTIDFDYKLDADNTEAAISVSFGRFQVFQKQDFPTGSQWAHVSVTGTTEEASTGINFDFLNFYTDHTQSMLLDNVVIKKAVPSDA